MKVDSKRSKKLNEIIKPLGVKKNFQVHIVPQKAPNAFTPGGKHVYITSGLLKLLNEREVEAVLLHEVYHAIDLHIIKRMATEFPLYYLCAPLAVAAAMGAAALGPVALILGMIVFSISLGILKIPLSVIIGRRHEYGADNYAVKAGYGKDIASALNKLEKMLTRMSAGQSCGKVCKVIRRIDEAMDEHPSTKKRIEKTLKDVELLKAVSKAKITAITYKIKKLFSKGD
jgi:Zn-dependent protease with chaperone function